MGIEFIVEWIDSGKEPQCKPDPAYPQGKDLVIAAGNVPSCMILLPYPAKRCGIYIVECNRCHTRVGCTTAGRTDDPRSMKIPCQRPRTEVN